MQILFQNSYLFLFFPSATVFSRLIVLIISYCLSAYSVVNSVLAHFYITCQ
nr:MAG TPA: hypothetical protein [Bacteriophage sp.]